jgi:hypothetical protein
MIATLHFLYMKENGTAVGAEMALVTFCCLPTLPRSDCRLEAGSNAQRQGIRKLKSPDLTGIGAAPEEPRNSQVKLRKGSTLVKNIHSWVGVFDWSVPDRPQTGQRVGEKRLTLFRV